MGVIPINFSPEVESFIKGNRAGTRSAVVDRVMKKYIQAKLSDTSSSLVEDLTAEQLINAATVRYMIREKTNTAYLDRLIQLRDILLEHMAGDL
jgi:uncharacterized protein (DUF2252 family)